MTSPREPSRSEPPPETAPAPVRESLQSRLFNALIFTALVPLLLLGYLVVDIHMRRPDLPVISFAILALLMAVLSIFLAWLTAASFRRRIFQPLEGFHQSLKSLLPAEADGAPPGGRDEIEQLVRQMEILVQFLVKQKQENEKTLRELEEKQRELKETNLRLEEAARLKSDFMANMSHELRTPMNAIIGYTSLLLDGVYGVLDPKQENALKRIMANARNLSSLINDILDLSKIEAGKLKLMMDRFVLRTVIEEIRQQFEPQVSAKGLAFDILVPESIMMVGDSARIRQMVTHLVDNAVKFTHKGTITVQCQLDSEKDEVVIAVRDTGIGIDKENIAKIFEEFHQLDSSYTREYGGTGLGLSLIRKLLHVMKGRVDVTSTVKEGSTFTLHLPRTFKDSELEMRPQPPAAAAVSNEEMKLLVVEDDPESIEILRDSLRGTKYNLFMLSEGVSVAQKARELNPFAILLDILMPGKDGWSVLQELKSDPVTSKIPVIIISIVDNKPLAFSLGVYDYIVKPVDRQILVDKLKKLEIAVSKKILVVDDERDCLVIMDQILKHEGYEVLLCQEGKRVVEIMQQEKPNIVFLDLMMPEVSGFDVVKEIEKVPELKSTPIIILTAKDLFGEELTFLKNKVNGIVQKSGFNRERILGELATVLASLEEVDRA